MLGPSCFLKGSQPLSVVPRRRKSMDVTSDETEGGVCAVAAFDAISAPARPELWSLAHPALAPAT